MFPPWNFNRRIRATFVSKSWTMMERKRKEPPTLCRRGTIDSGIGEMKHLVPCQRLYDGIRSQSRMLKCLISVREGRLRIAQASEDVQYSEK